MRIITERFFEGSAGRGQVALLALDHAATGQGTEMSRLELEDLVDIFERVIVAAEKEIDGRPLVPRFGIVRMHGDHFVEDGKSGGGFIDSRSFRGLREERVRRGTV